MNRNEAYYVAIDSGKRIKIVALTRDSVLLCKSLGNADKYNIGFIENCDMAGGYLFSTCQNVVSSHERSVLLFFDRVLNKWIEYSSLDGYIGEALEENKNFVFLKQLYKFVGKVFKDQVFIKYMIDKVRERKALKAIHRLLCHGRKLAYEGVGGEQMAKFFDDLEYLPALMLQESDTTDFFEEYLRGTCEYHNCIYIFALYEKE